MKKLILIIVAIVVVKMVLAQEYKGLVQDAKTQEKLAYVNIGIVGKGVGTVSNINGEYIIKLEDKYDNDTLKFSIIGYEPRIFKVKDYKKIAISITSIVLYQKAVDLKQVVIIPKRIVTKTVGNTSSGRALTAGFSSNQLGSEVCTYMNIKARPTNIERIQFSIAENKYDSVTFRINVYNQKDGKPNENILKQPLYVTTKIKSGIVTVDVKKYNIVVDDDFYVALEWIKDLGKDGLMFSASLIGANSLVRDASQNNWEGYASLGIGINCVVSYEKD